MLAFLSRVRQQLDVECGDQLGTNLSTVSLLDQSANLLCAAVDLAAVS